MSLRRVRALARPACLVLALLAWAGAARAEDISIQAGLDRNVASPGEQLVYQLTVRGGGNTGPRLAPMPQFQVFAAGTSRSMSWVNGAMSTSATYNYILVPKSVGRFTLGPAELEQGGKVFRSNTIEVEIRAGASPQQAAPAPSGGGGPQGFVPTPGGRRAPRGREIFVTASVDKKRPYANEQVTWTFRFYNSVMRLARTPEYTGPPVVGFWSEDLPPQRNFYEVVDGTRYYVTELRMGLFPTTPGRHVIGAATLRCEVQDVPDLDPDDPFSVFRGLGRPRAYSLTTDPITLEAQDLPHGPADFQGAVGRYSLEASVDRQEVRQNEPVTLTVRIRGRGNIKTVPDPQLPPMNNFKSYPGSSGSNLTKNESVVRGEKTVQTVLIPQVTGEYTIPALALTFFDPAERRYQTVRTEPIPVRVRAGVAENAPPPMGGAGGAQAAGDVRYIRTGPASWSVPRDSFFQTPWPWALDALPVLGWLAALILLDRRSRESVGGGGRRAPAVRAALRRLRTGETADATAASTAAVEQALSEFLSDALRLPPEFSREQLGQELESRGAEAAERATLLAPLERLDQARYAPGSLGFADRAEIAEALEHLLRRVDQLRRQKRRRIA